MNLKHLHELSLRHLTISRFSRFAVFIVYFWFGLLKVWDLSPAGDLVKAMHDMLIPFIDLRTFMVLFGLLEMVVGSLFLIPKVTKYAKLIFFGHVTTTILPLVLLPAMIWSGFLTPTLEGQYIIKNILLIALVLNIH